MFEPGKLQHLISTDRATARKVEAPALDEIGLCLMRAAEIIEKRGWCQIHFRSAKGEVCMVGAIQEAAGHSMEDYMRLGAPAHRAIMQHGYGMCWNDSRGRTKEEVTGALRSVALTRAQAALERL